MFCETCRTRYPSAWFVYISPWAYSQEPGRSNIKMQWFSVILAFRVWYHLPPEWHLRVWPLVSCKYRISNALPVSSCRKSRLHIAKMKQLAVILFRPSGTCICNDLWEGTSRRHLCFQLLLPKSSKCSRNLMTSGEEVKMSKVSKAKTYHILYKHLQSDATWLWPFHVVSWSSVVTFVFSLNSN